MFTYGFERCAGRGQPLQSHFGFYTGYRWVRSKIIVLKTFYIEIIIILSPQIFISHKTLCIETTDMFQLFLHVISAIFSTQPKLIVQFYCFSKWSKKLLQSWLPWAGAWSCLCLCVSGRFVFGDSDYQESVPTGSRAGVCRWGCCSPASLQLWAWVSSYLPFEMSLKFGSLSYCVIMNPSQVIQIMVALFHLGLGPRQIFTFPVDSTDKGATFWLGVVVNYTSILWNTCFSVVPLFLYLVFNVVLCLSVSSVPHSWCPGCGCRPVSLYLAGE